MGRRAKVSAPDADRYQSQIVMRRDAKGAALVAAIRVHAAAAWERRDRHERSLRRLLNRVQTHSVDR